MRVIALILLLLSGFSVLEASRTEAAGLKTLGMASIDHQADGLRRNFTPSPKNQDVSSYVCGAGSGYPSANCSDGHLCCFATRGYYFCCAGGSQCGGDGNCY